MPWSKPLLSELGNNLRIESGVKFSLFTLSIEIRFDGCGYLMVLSEVSQSVGPFETKMQVWVTLNC